MLPPPEKSPILLLRWTQKAQQDPELIRKIQAELEKYHLLIVPSPAKDTLLLTATQESLEQQAEWDHLSKKRRIAGPSSVDIIMDYFTLQNRGDFCNISNPNKNDLFSAHERCHLVVGLLERISIEDSNLLQSLSEDSRQYHSTNLRYLLQSQGWIDVLTPLHVNDEKFQIHKQTWYPLFRMMPPVEEIDAYYGPQIAYYFAFMGFLGTWLARLGVVGFCVHVFRLYRKDTIDEDEVRGGRSRLCTTTIITLTHNH